ncbi:hypothetical protein, partial [Mesorhizobium sp. M1A.F.Ca.ET.072.01.1.1]|uniref:hypothetical protein n=1 Tax=Mesorhizobium sp. M1A.F.Ca.ET.072.01.1.1 TaxID=2496753 RepID=UPI001AEC83E8
KTGGFWLRGEGLPILRQSFPMAPMKSLFPIGIKRLDMPLICQPAYGRQRIGQPERQDWQT